MEVQATSPMNSQDRVVGKDGQEEEEESPMYSKYIITPAIQQAEWEELSMDCGSI